MYFFLNLVWWSLLFCLVAEFSDVDDEIGRNVQRGSKQERDEVDHDEDDDDDNDAGVFAIC